MANKYLKWHLTSLDKILDIVRDCAHQNHSKILLWTNSDVYRLNDWQ